MLAYSDVPLIISIIRDQINKCENRFVLPETDIKVKISATLRMIALHENGHICSECGAEGTVFVYRDNALNLMLRKNSKKMITRDHIISKSNGGTNALHNIKPLCSPCNNAKADNCMPHEYTRGYHYGIIIDDIVQQYPSCALELKRLKVRLTRIKPAADRKKGLQCYLMDDAEVDWLINHIEHKFQIRIPQELKKEVVFI